METLNAVQAGRWLGFTERTVRNMINRGELQLVSADPVRLDPRHVDQVLRARQADVVRDLARTHKSAVHLARETAEVLRPPNEDQPLPDRVATRQRLKLSLVPDRAKLMFGTASLNAALVDDGSCRWCTAADFARVLGVWGPERYSEGFRELFGQRPCAACGPRLYGPVMASLSARVHGGAERPSKAAPRPSAAERQAAREYVQQRAVTAGAKPVDDDGKALVAAGLRTARARLKDAKRRGDQRAALHLAQVIRGLEMDAAVVDGRTTAAARPGRLRCGHPLSQDCGCPRRASKRGRS